MVGILLDLLIGLYMKWKCHFMLSSADILIRKNGYSFGKYPIKNPLKSSVVTELTSLVETLPAVDSRWTVRRNGENFKRKGVKWALGGS